MKEPIVTGEFGERDVTTAVESLNSASFKARFIRTDRNAADPEWKAPSGQAIHEHVRDQMYAFKKDVEAVPLPHHFHGGVFHRFGGRPDDLLEPLPRDRGYSKSATILTVAYSHLSPEPPIRRTSRVSEREDLLHLYRPDRNNIKDWEQYYRYAWMDKAPPGPVTIIYSTDTEIIQQGKLRFGTGSYSGQSSYALVGAGMFFLPQFGNRKVSISPYVQWLTKSNFTFVEGEAGAAAAYFGIYVESRARSGGEHNVDRDHLIPVWSQTTQGYMQNVTAGGTIASVGDGLTTEIFAVTQRKYYIFVYAYLETSAEPPRQERNVFTYVDIDIDATIPYVVVQELP
jgi:hypothetical protein